jgi:hypothetical protein
MTRLFRPTRQTKEEKAAVEIGDILSDFRLDLEALGYYVARSNPYTIYRRFENVAESALAEREGLDDTRMENYNDRLL